MVGNNREEAGEVVTVEGMQSIRQRRLACALHVK